MKICHVLWGLTYGGIETMVINIANEQAALGHKVYLLIVNDKIDVPIIDNISPAVQLLQLGRKVGSRNPLPILKLNIVLFRLNCDVIHLHHVKLYKYLITPMRRKSCTTHHTDCVPWLRKYIPKTPRLFSISRLVHDDILRQTGIETITIMNGIDSGKFKKKRNDEIYNGHKPFRIIQIGRLDTTTKGQHILIEAASILRDRDIQFEVDIIGEGTSMEILDSMINQLNLSEFVKLRGSRSPEWIWQNLSSYDLLVQPSLHEGFGLVIAEGMAAKVPVLVSDIEVQLEVTGNGKYGYTFKSEDTESCANAIENIIRNYDFKITDGALQHVLSNFDVKATAFNYTESYKKMFNL